MANNSSKSESVQTDADAVLLERHEGWAELILNRPATRNAINGPLGEGLAAHARAINDDPSIGAVLLRGAGGAFCSGLDLKAFNAEPPPAWLAEFPVLWRGAHKALFELKATLVVAVERYAINGGAALALAGDFMIIGDDAFVHVGEVQQGMAAPYNLAWLRFRHSEALTARVALLGQRISGLEAVQLGLAYQAVPNADVLSAAQDFTRALAAYPEGASAHVKAISRAYSEADADAWFDRAFAVGPAPSQRPRAND